MNDLFLVKSNTNYEHEWYEPLELAIDVANDLWSIEENIISWVEDDYGVVVWVSPNYQK